MSSVRVLKLPLTAGAFPVLHCRIADLLHGRHRHQPDDLATPEALLAFASTVIERFRIAPALLEARLAPQWTVTIAIPCSDACATAVSMSSTTPTSVPSAPWIA